MQIPVLIEPLSDGSGFRARVGSPLELQAEAATAEEAGRLLAEAIRSRLLSGARLVSLSIPGLGALIPLGEKLPDDQLSRDWLEAIAENRRRRDREELEQDAAEEPAA